MVPGQVDGPTRLNEPGKLAMVSCRLAASSATTSGSWSSARHEHVRHALAIAEHRKMMRVGTERKAALVYGFGGIGYERQDGPVFPIVHAARGGLGRGRHEGGSRRGCNRDGRGRLNGRHSGLHRCAGSQECNNEQYR